MDLPKKPQTISIDGVIYNFDEMNETTKDTIALMEYTRQQVQDAHKAVQAAQSDLNMKISAYDAIGGRLRIFLGGVKPYEAPEEKAAPATRRVVKQALNKGQGKRK